MKLSKVAIATIQNFFIGKQGKLKSTEVCATQLVSLKKFNEVSK